jgi:Lrp/AsnC family transcriptional regulator, regulator for asnA, asnC and gidA
MIKKEERELVLMSYLRQNSRMSLTKLSRKTGIPISTIFDKLKNANGGLIQKHISLLDFEKLGFSTRASILIKLGKKNRNEVKEHLLKTFNINSLVKVNNGYDYLMEGIFHNLRELESFLDQLDERFTLKKKEVLYHLEEMKKEEFLSDPNLVRYIMA